MAEKPQTNEDLQKAVAAAFSAAVDHFDNTHAADLQEAIDYYKCLKPEAPMEEDANGEAKQSGSGFVYSEVRDVIMAMIPSIMDVFMQGDDIARFVAERAEDTSWVDLAKKYVRRTMDLDGNDSFSLFHAMIFNALVARMGVLAWEWIERDEVTEERYSGLQLAGAAALLLDESIEPIEYDVSIDPPYDDSVTPALKALVETGQLPGSPEEILATLPPHEISLTVRRRWVKKFMQYRVVEPGLFVHAPDSQDLETGWYFAERESKKVSDLIAEGHDLEDLEEYASAEPFYTDEMEFMGLRSSDEHLEDVSTVGASDDKSTWYVPLVTHFIKFDLDGDGIAERLRVRTVGEECGMILGEPEMWADVDYAVACAYPMPGRLIGESVYDDVGDLQDLKTQIMRDLLDNLADVANPQTEVHEAMANLEDLMESGPGGFIRVKQPGAVRRIESEFIGSKVLPVISYVDEIRAARSGMTKASQGLDPDVLQSTVKEAVTATLSAAQQRIKMVSRNLAQTGWKRFLKGALRAFVRHQDAPRWVMFSDASDTVVDPRQWRAEVAVEIDPDAGTEDVAAKMGLMMQVLTEQKSIIAQFGAENPYVQPANVMETHKEILRLGGYKNGSRFFRQPSAEELQQFVDQQKQRAAGKKDPQQTLAEAEVEKERIKAEGATQKLDFERGKAFLADDRERDRIRADMILRMMQMKGGAPLTEMEIAFVDATLTALPAAQILTAQITQPPAPKQEAPPQQAEPQGM